MLHHTDQGHIPNYPCTNRSGHFVDQFTMGNGPLPLQLALLAQTANWKFQRTYNRCTCDTSNIWQRAHDKLTIRTTFVIPIAWLLHLSFTNLQSVMYVSLCVKLQIHKKYLPLYSELRTTTILSSDYYTAIRILFMYSAIFFWQDKVYNTL